MPDELTPEPVSTNVPVWRSWLAANKKLAILIGLAIVLLIAAGLVLWRPWARTTSSVGTNEPVTNTATGTTNSSPTTTNRSFIRDQAVVNRAAPNAATNIPRPSKEQTAQAIQALTNSSTNTNSSH